MLTHTAYGKSDVGRRRNNNEDALLVDKEFGLFVVCDGLGGHAAGEVASDTAAKVIQRVVAQHAQTFRNYKDEPTFLHRAKALTVLELAVEAASREIYELSQADTKKKGMATTVALLMCCGDNALVAHVGDSRVYLYRQGRTYQVTEDHTVVNEQIKRGMITTEQAAQSKKTGIISRAVGFLETVQVETLHVELMPGDTFLICSDGLHDYFRGGEFAETVDELGADKLKKLPDRLIKIALERGGADNITCIVVGVTGELGKDVTDAARKLEALRRIPMFQHLSYQELLKVLSIARVKAYEPEAIVLEEGDPGQEMYVSVAGQVEVIKMGQVLTTLPVGSFFGEMALLDDSPRSATILAKDKARLLTISRDDFYRLLKSEHELAAKLLWAFCQVLNNRLRSTTEQLTEARFGPADEKDIQGFFEELNEEIGPAHIGDEFADEQEPLEGEADEPVDEMGQALDEYASSTEDEEDEDDDEDLSADEILKDRLG